MANAGEFRFGGRWGSAWDSSGNLLAEVVEVAAPVELNRINVPLVGTGRDGHKMGPETREGTMRVQKIDTKWELFVYSILSQSLSQRRAARDGRIVLPSPEFSIVLKWDDPEALGVERWQLDGCRVWRLTLGFSLADETIEREYPLTWESETPLTAFRRRAGAGAPKAEYLIGAP